MKQESVTVLLPVYNGAEYLPESVDSILKQTHVNLEILLINDGSDDETHSIIEAYARKDSRVIPIHKRNEGLVKTLNVGLSKATGDYICRMDADDVADVTRIQKQLEFLRLHNLDICGSDIIRVKYGRKPRYASFPPTHAELVYNLLTFGRVIAHPTCLAKKKVFENLRYDEFKHIEDYALWLDIMFNTDFKMGNISEPLLKYREHSKQVSAINKKIQEKSMYQLFFSRVSSITSDVTYEMCNLHLLSLKENKRLTIDQLEKYSVFVRFISEFLLSKNVPLKKISTVWQTACVNGIGRCSEKYNLWKSIPVLSQSHSYIFFAKSFLRFK